MKELDSVIRRVNKVCAQIFKEFTNEFEVDIEAEEEATADSESDFSPGVQ